MSTVGVGSRAGTVGIGSGDGGRCGPVGPRILRLLSVMTCLGIAYCTHVGVAYAALTSDTVQFTNSSDSVLTLKSDTAGTCASLASPPATIAVGQTVTFYAEVPSCSSLVPTEFSVQYELASGLPLEVKYTSDIVDSSAFIDDGEGASGTAPEGYLLDQEGGYVGPPRGLHEEEVSTKFACTSTVCDGIPDEWKKNGVYIDPSTGKAVSSSTPGAQFVDLPKMGVSLDRPTVLVQMDWMEDSTHNQKFKQASIDKVIEAYNKDPVTYPGATRSGITLVVDAGPDSTITPGGATWGSLSRASAIPWKEYFTTGGRGHVIFKPYEELVEKSFLPTGRGPIFHYDAVVAQLSKEAGCTSGWTPDETVGAGSILSLGGAGCWAQNEYEQGGTFMHEFGHVLGLKHCGEAESEECNFSPAYPSVMNYLYQTVGVARNGARELDYSRSPENSLDETKLTEMEGMPALNEYSVHNPGYGVSWICPEGTSNAGRVNFTYTLAGMDWNCDSKIDGGTGFDVNGYKACTGSGCTATDQQVVLPASVKSDWQRIKFRTSGVGTGNAAEGLATLPGTGEEVDEVTPEIAAAVRVPPRITYTGALSGSYHAPATVSATLVDPTTDDSPVEGARITFQLGTSPSDSCTAATNSSGSASCTITPTQAAGPYNIVASFGGSSEYQPESATQTFTIEREQTTLSYDGPTEVVNGAPATLTGTLLAAGATAPSPAGQSVMFTLGSGATAQSCTGTVSATGSVQCEIPSVNQPDSASFTVPVSAEFAGDAYYLPSSSPPASVQLLYYTGRAYGSSYTLFSLPALITADTGVVTTAQAETVLRSGTTLSFGLGKLTVPTASVSTGGGSVTATASGSSFSLSGLFVPTIQASRMTATSHSSCAGSSGSSTISSITINGTTMTVPNRPPNTVIPLPLGGSITLNQQIPAAGGHGLTVNALHVSIPGVIDYVQSSATTGVHNCP